MSERRTACPASLATIGLYRSGASTVADRIDKLIQWLKSLHGGEAATFALIDCGRAAVPALKRVLYQRDPSGIFEPRCRAVKALAGIGAQEVLLEFLRAAHDEPDPVARLGEEAVINAAARALTGLHTDEFYELLTRMAQRQLLCGIIEALADFGRYNAIPVLIAALTEDFSRAAAEEGLRRLRASAREALIEAARSPDRSREPETASSLRRRWSALQLLLDIGVHPADWSRLRPLIGEDDPMLAFLACKLCLLARQAGDKAVAIKRLIALLADCDWFLAGEVEDCLVRNFVAAKEFVDRQLNGNGDEPDRQTRNLRLFRTLQRVKARAEASL
jgi:hypothetical protein